jgi:RND family efflux transporter MFP subunit
VNADAGLNRGAAGSRTPRESWSVGVAFSLPLFEGFAPTAEVQAQRAFLEASRFDETATRQRIEGEVWDAYLFEDESASRLDNARALFDAARENLEAAQESYRLGLGSMIALVDARTAFTDAERILIQAQYDRRHRPGDPGSGSGLRLLQGESSMTGKAWLGVGALLVLAVAGWFTLRPTGDRDQQTQEVHTVGRRDISATVMAMGVVRPMVGAEVKVGSRVSGVVTRLRANIGDHVRAGEVIAEIDDAEFRARLVQSEASLARARAEAELAEVNLERLETMVEREFVSRQQVDVAESALQVALAQEKLAEANLESARIQLSYTRITAPVSGVVASVATQEGETVAASFAAPTFVNIIDLDRLEVQAYVDETDIGRIQEGQAARFSVDSYPAEEFEGVVTAIYPKAVIQDNVVNYVVTVEITDRKDRTLRPEMTAAVTIVLEPRADVLAVPAVAVGRDRAERFVTVMENGMPVRRTVRVGWTQGGWTEITDGLAEGERVLLPQR